MDAQTQHSPKSLAALALSDPKQFLIDLLNIDEGNAGIDEYDVVKTLLGERLRYENSTMSVGGITLSLVEEVGGREGGGESVVRVVKVTDDTGLTVTFLRMGGYYASYEGTEWDNDVEVVYPREVTVIQYFNIDEPA